MRIIRSTKNPIIQPKDVKPLHDGHEVIGVFNAGVAEYYEETILLLRVAERPISDSIDTLYAPYFDVSSKKLKVSKYDKNDDDYIFSDPRVIAIKETPNKFKNLTSVSYVRLARSINGVDFTIDDEAFIYPFNEYNIFGVEDARCTKIDDTYYITYSAVSEKGITVQLVTTEDFQSYDYVGNILAPENKDVMFFPEKINSLYYMLHRPVIHSVGELDIWLSSSPDLVHWGNHEYLFGIRENKWDSSRTGGGVPPIKTEHGWVVLYHGADEHSRYCMGAVLLDLSDPTKVLARLDKPFLEPEFDYEQKGFFGDVVFGCGVTLNDDTVTMYYGVSDTSLAVCDFSLKEITDELVRER